MCWLFQPSEPSLRTHCSSLNLIILYHAVGLHASLELNYFFLSLSSLSLSLRIMLCMKIFSLDCVPVKVRSYSRGCSMLSIFSIWYCSLQFENYMLCCWPSETSKIFIFNVSFCLELTKVRGTSMGRNSKILIQRRRTHVDLENVFLLLFFASSHGAGLKITAKKSITRGKESDLCGWNGNLERFFSSSQLSVSMPSALRWSAQNEAGIWARARSGNLDQQNGERTIA